MHDPNQCAGARAPLPLPSGAYVTWAPPLSWVGAPLAATVISPGGARTPLPVAIDGRALRLVGMPLRVPVRVTLWPRACLSVGVCMCVPVCV